MSPEPKSSGPVGPESMRGAGPTSGAGPVRGAGPTSDAGPIGAGQHDHGPIGQPAYQDDPIQQKPSALPVEEREYQHFLRTPRARWWKGALAIVTLVAAYLLVSTVLIGVAIGIDLATGRTTLDALNREEIVITPIVFLMNNLSLAAMLPVAMLLQWAFFGQRPRWLSSVEGGFRWRWFGRAALVIVPIWVVYVGVSYLLDPSGLETEVVPDGIFLLVVVLLTTPLQAAGEEYAARGLIARSAGSWASRSFPALIIGAVVANVLFMLAHGSTDPWLIAYYFVFGVVMSIIAWRTGGLEVPVLIHATNNLFLLVPAALFSDLNGAFERSAGMGGPIMLVPMLLMVATVFVVERMSRRAGILRRSAPGQMGRAATPVG